MSRFSDKYYFTRVQHEKIRDGNRNERRDQEKSRLFNDKEFHPEKVINTL